MSRKPRKEKLPKVEIIEITDPRVQLLRPSPDKCQQCAIIHDPAFPHDQQSFYYRYFFYKHNGRWPTWKDALAHCSEDMKKKWIKALAERGIHVD